jgi:hypothetical protein
MDLAVILQGHAQIVPLQVLYSLFSAYLYYDPCFGPVNVPREYRESKNIVLERGI